jgi:hypothetical protein
MNQLIVTMESQRRKSQMITFQQYLILLHISAVLIFSTLMFVLSSDTKSCGCGKKIKADMRSYLSMSACLLVFHSCFLIVLSLRNQSRYAELFSMSACLRAPSPPQGLRFCKHQSALDHPQHLVFQHPNAQYPVIWTP